ncbi:hypothetical protein JZ751_006034 [Albula glossodonta]|uniref:Tudor domain-containing protein n=1 Tax=Albula glossodonta TaxID=121402 RepID=A0A8T2PED8_9TELE|nr:hypothetical protein JZ751_006034 [Albula glossodonta]
MDEYLKSKGFYRKKIAKDGSCLFRAVAEQVLRCQSRHTEFIEGNFEEYLQRLEDPQVRLCFLNGNHYDSVYPTEFVNNAALCQSILYELLYERVYGVDHNVVARYIKSSGGVGHDGYGECKSSEESDLEEEDDFWANDADVPSNMNNSGSSNRNHSSKNAKSHQSRSSLSQRVRQSLNPSYFRNVEYDIWLRSKRAQQKRDFCIAAGMQYSVGDKCKVRLDNRGKFYSAYIQAVRPNNGPVTVFIEELGEKHSIPLWNLRPSSVEGESWSTVAERGKRLGLVNGNGHHSERDGRGGRRQGKGPANAHAPMAGPSGRVQKQHSWPPQATADEQASGRNAQEPHFGLSPDERQAREEEQRSQALLEIMHRDERSFPALGIMPPDQAREETANSRLQPSLAALQRQTVLSYILFLSLPSLLSRLLPLLLLYLTHLTLYLPLLLQHHLLFLPL